MTVHRFSRRLIEHLARPEATFRPRSLELASELPARAAALETALLEAAAERGLPVLDGWALGAGVAAASSGAPVTRTGPAGVEALIGHHPTAGAAYLRADSRIVRGAGGTMARESHTWLERLVLLEQFGAPVHARCSRMPRSAHRVAEASDGWVDCWLDGELLFLTHDTDVEVRCSSLVALSSFLAWASRERAEVHLDGTADYEILVDPSEAAEPADAVYRVARRSVYACTVDAEQNAAVECKARQGRLLTSVRFESGNGIARLHDAASRALAGRVSARFIGYANAAGIVRVPEERLSLDAFARELDRRGLPFFDAWFEFEETFGGLSWESCEPYWDAAPPQLGVRQFLCESPSEAEDLEEGSRWLRDAAFPAARIADELVLRVAYNPPGADRWLMDERGRVHALRIRHAPEEERIDRLRLEADSVTTALERIALRWEIRTELPGAAPVVLEVFLGERLASELGASIVAEASDAAALVHRIDDVWIGSRPDGPPGGPRTTLLGRDPVRVAEVVRVIRSLSSEANARVRSDLPGGSEQRAALEAIGIPVGPSFP